MQKIRFVLAAGLAAMATIPTHAATLFMGAYPDVLLVFDEGKGAVTQKIKLDTGLPTAMTIASADLDFAQRLAETISTDTFRAYTSTDIAGVEVGALGHGAFSERSP